MDEEFRKEIVSCVEKSMQTEDFSNMTIDLAGTNRKGQGYIADFVFATVTGTDKDNKHKEEHLAIKFGKRVKELRENLPVLVECYRREHCFYAELFPALRRFQLERNVADIFDAFPKCYGAFMTDKVEALVLDDLKSKAWTLHDEKVTMNMQHLKLVLRNYAKFHALSFAMQDQNREEFKKLTAGWKSLLRTFILTMGVVKDDGKVQRKLREAGREDLAAEYDKETERGKETILVEIIDDVPKESVIVHGDCHNNNFLFEYEDKDKVNPVNVVMIDWQISEIHSPVIDLSYFLYCAASKKELSQDELLKYYHFHLTSFLEVLGSDVEKLYPYTTLVEHWRKYSIHGFILGTSLLQMFYVDKEDAPSIDGYRNRGDLNNVMDDVRFKNEDVFRERLISIVDFYFSSKPT